MLECIAFVMTIGAMLYQRGHTSFVIFGALAIILAVIPVVILKSTRSLIFGIVIGLSIVCGALLIWQHDTVVQKDLFGNRAFDAIVVSVNRELDKTVLIVRDRAYDYKLQISILVKNNLLPGDLVAITGSVETPEDFITETGRIFPYKTYLESKGIVGLVQHAKIHLVRQGGFTLTRLTTVLRFYIADIFMQYVTFPVDGILSGMLVGYQGGIPDTIHTLFKNTGVLHVLVLSGYNITLLAGFMGILMRKFPFRIRTGVTITAIIFLVLISGAGVASIRAGITGSIALVAGLSIRTYRPVRALVLAYLFFFSISPMTIFVDPGFHLSFLATLCMIVVMPKIEQFFSFIPSTRYLDVRELVMLAVIVPLFMLPYTMYFSGMLPISSGFANIVLAVVTPPLMLLGVLLMMLSWIPFVASILGWIVSSIGYVVLIILQLCSTLPIWNTPGLGAWGVDVLYIVIIVVLFRTELNEFFVQLRNSLQRQTNSYY